MSWLEDIQYTLEYKCPEGHESFMKWRQGEDKPETVWCPTCKKDGKDILAVYQGFQPVELSIATKISYEKNGRLAYEIRQGNKPPVYLSKTKMDYLEKGTIKSGISKSYETHMKDNTEREFGAYKKQLDSNATVTSADKGAKNE